MGSSSKAKSQVRTDGGFHKSLDLLIDSEDSSALTHWLRHHLFSHVLPFWEKYAMDPEGGIFTCIADDGRLLNTEKWLWSQWRAVWVFAKIFNDLDAQDKWRVYATQIAEFCLRHGWMEQDEGWALLLDQKGTVLRGCESIYVDAFAIYGLTELFRATEDLRYRQWAVRTAEAFLKKLSGSYDQIPHFPYPIPQGAKPQGIPMMASLVLAELGNVLGEAKYLEAAMRLHEEIFSDYYDPETQCIRELVSLSGGAFQAPEGKVVVPGHVIENMWFQLRVQDLVGTQSPHASKMRKLILRHLEWGWDSKEGGLFLAVNKDGSHPVAWKFADSKLWWPHTEILIATLWAWKDTEEEEYLQWYREVWNLCLKHFVDWEHGEWRQKLARDFTPLQEVVALPVKDPFHLPRSLILQIEILEQWDKNRRNRLDT